MSQKKDIKTVRNFKNKEGKEVAVWTKIGTATSMDGDRWRLNFNAIPINWSDGMFLMTPFAKDGGGGGGGSAPPEDWD